MPGRDPKRSITGRTASVNRKPENVIITDQLTTSEVWDAIKEEPFAVLGVVTARNECRTVGIIYEVDNQKLYIS